VQGGRNKIADVLNALDGVDGKSNAIRFFTCNNVDVIVDNLAFMTRMNSIFDFKYPNFQELNERFDTLIKFHCNQYDQNKYGQFLAALNMINHPISYRTFTKYCIRYLFGDNWLDNLLANIHELRS